MPLTTNVWREYANVQEAFADFLASLPPEWATKHSTQALRRLDAAFENLTGALDNDSIERRVSFVDAANHARTFRLASHVFHGLVLDVLHAHTAHDPAQMVRHFDTFNRAVKELNAPLPTTEEIREETKIQLQPLI